MIRRFSLFSLLMVVAVTYGTEVEGLYETQVPVASKDGAARRQAMAEALRLVLVKLAGDRKVGEKRGVESLLKNAESFVQRFGYRQGLRWSDAARTRPPLVLWALFDQRALDRALGKVGVRTWGRERPALLVWLAIDEGGNRHLVGANDASPYILGIHAQANARGVPILLPLLDLEDETQLQVGDVWEGDGDKIAGASRRYTADAVLTGTLTSPQAGGWEGHWTLYVGSETRPWSTQGDRPDVVLGAGIDGAADLLAIQFVGQVAQEGDRLQVQIAGIANADQYARVQRYLRTLNSVAGVSVETVEPDRVVFSLRARGGAEVITQAIALGRTLEPVAPETGSYRLLPD